MMVYLVIVSLDFSNFLLVFCLVHDRIYIHDETLVYASLD